MVQFQARKLIMDFDIQRHLLNQFFINNVEYPDRKIYMFKTPREALAKRIAGEWQEPYISTQLKFYKSYADSAKTSFKGLFYKEPSKVNESFNAPFDHVYEGNVRDVTRFLFNHLPCSNEYIASSRQKDELAERQTIETNLTYDGYCALLSCLTDDELLYYQDSITKGIDNEATASLSQASSILEEKNIREEFLQLKAASEYLIGNAEAKRFDMQEGVFSTGSNVLNNFEQ